MVCPQGGRYSINPIGKDPACSIHGTLSAPLQPGRRSGPER